MKLVIAAAALFIVAFQNCSKVQFSAQEDGSFSSLGPSDVETNEGVDAGVGQPAVTDSTGGTTPATTTGTGTGTGGDRAPASTTPVELPHVTFYGPLCLRGTTCLADFTLSKAMPYEVSFYWRTNDSAYLTPSTNPQYIVGQPGVHYVSKGPLLITFAPGETKKPITIQNINQTNNAIWIPVRMEQCAYAGVPLNCTDIF